MFRNSVLFNQDISEWNVSSCRTMYCMFFGAKSFNQDISEWDVSRVEDMRGMFRKTGPFNQDPSDWSWDLNLINEAFTDDKFEELCDQMSYGAFEDRELHKLSEDKLEILVENNIIGEETALSYSI